MEASWKELRKNIDIGRNLMEEMGKSLKSHLTFFKVSSLKVRSTSLSVLFEVLFHFLPNNNLERSEKKILKESWKKLGTKLVKNCEKFLEGTEEDLKVTYCPL